MIQEEKAKAYDEALEKAKKYHEECKMRGNDWFVEDIEDMFHELKESEDERIRKKLIDYFNICSGDYYGELKRKDIIAWLEKQGE